MIKTFSQRYAESDFHKDSKRINFSDLLHITATVIDAKVLKDFNGKFGKHDAVLIYAKLAEPTKAMNEPDTDCYILAENGDVTITDFTTISSGSVVVDQIKRALSDKALPLMATFAKVETDTGNTYYQLQ
jgi:hypothetical protein